MPSECKRKNHDPIWIADCGVDKLPYHILVVIADANPMRVRGATHQCIRCFDYFGRFTGTTEMLTRKQGKT
jgi:hypothetical protein